MTLPELPFKIPEIPLPFDIPTLMHPPVVHFMIALPVIVLLLELINLVVKKRTIGFTAFFLIVLTVVAAAAAYLTGSTDGTAAWDLLTQDAQSALKAHKLFGTYLLLASGILFVFKLLSALINRGLMKAMYLLVLIIFVAGILKQGKEGGELVYVHGANVKIVKIKDDKLFDCQDDLSDYVAEEKEAEEEAAKAAEEAKKAEAAKAAEEAKKAEEAKAAAEAKKAEDAKAAESAKAEEPASTEAVTEEKVETPAATEEAPTVEAETPVAETEAAGTEEAAPAEAVEVEKVSPPAEAQPEVATH